MPAYAFIASLATWADLEAEQDDPSVKELDLETFAAPQVSDVALNITDDWIRDLKERATNEVSSACDEPTALTWVEGAWNVETAPRRSHQVLKGFFAGGQELAVVVVIQQVAIFQ